MKKLKLSIIILSSILILGLILGLAGIYVSGMMFDSHFQRVIAKVNSSKLKLEHEALSSSFSSRTGRVYFTLNTLDTKKLTGALDYELNLGLFSADFDVKKVFDVGNIDSIVESLGIDRFNFKGKAHASLLSLKAQGALKFDSFNLKVNDGLCHIGENSLFLDLISTKSANTELSSAGISCKSSLTYNQKTAYDLLVKDLALKSQISYDKGAISINNFALGLKDLVAEASTLYLIGFSPQEKVNDPSVREGFELHDVALNLKLSDKDANHRQALLANAVGNLAFAFPVVRDNVRQDLYAMDKLNFDLSFEKANFTGLFKQLSRSLSKQDGSLLSLLDYLNDSPTFKVNKFSFNHQGESFESQGKISVTQKDRKIDFSSLSVHFEGQAGKNMVRSFTEKGYTQALEQQVSRGAIDYDGKNYHTVIDLKGSNFTLNGIPATIGN